MTLLITFISVVAGLSAACFEYRFTGHRAFPEGSPQEAAFVFDLCVTFFLATFGVGRTLYSLFGLHTRAAELGRRSSAHLLLLHIFSFILALLLAFPLLRPATLLTASLAAFSVYESLRRRRPIA